MTAPPVAVVLALGAAILLLLLAGWLTAVRRVERAERQAAVNAEAHRRARLRDFDDHVDGALAVASPVDWRRHEAEWSS